MTALPAPLALLVGGGVLGLSLVGAGVYAIAPLSDDDTTKARAVVEDYVRAWSETRCDDAVAHVHGPRDKVLRQCRANQTSRLRGLEVTGTEVELDGDRGTARVEVRFERDGRELTEAVHEDVVRVDGTWLVAWREE
jgi:hypothetical protein